MKDLQQDCSGKFADPFLTADGKDRARVRLSDPQTLWFNTGTLCNIECRNCYIESSPTNDALVYITADEVTEFLDQLVTRNWAVSEIGFTGGEPFMNPEFPEMLRRSLSRGYRALVLTNAMQPMMRPHIRAALTDLQHAYGDKLTIRVSVDHWSENLHDEERGRGSFAKTLQGMEWLRDSGIKTTVAGRSVWRETEAEARAGYAGLYAEKNFEIDAFSVAETVIFPEMTQHDDVPEITTECWSILGKAPSSVMCSSSRMVVKRRGAARPAVLACTLLPFDRQFELGPDLASAEQDVFLNHRHCAQFCVLGGASCSG